MEYKVLRAASCFAAAIMLMRGVELPLASAEDGVAVPEWLAGVLVVGRRLEMMPVFVLWNSTGVFELSVSVSSCMKVSECHLRLKRVRQKGIPSHYYTL